MRASPAWLFLGLSLNATIAKAGVEPTDTQVVLEPPAYSLGAEASRTDLVALRNVFMEIGDFTGALNPAQQIVDQTSQEIGEADPRLVPELNALAAIQREIGEHALAEANYLRSINILESHNNKFPPELVEPYHGLGKSFIATGQYVAAKTVLDQARHVSRRNLGLFNLEQTAIIDDQTIALVGLGDITAAGELQRDRLNLAVRTLGMDNPQLVPYIYDLADYYADSRMKNRARSQYQRAVEVLAADSGEYAAELLPPLQAIIALNLGDRDIGEEAIRIRSILDNNDQLEPLQRALALASLGDWHRVRLDSAEDALRYYRAAYAAAPTENRDGIFAAPVLLDFTAPINSVTRRKARDLHSAIGEINLEFTVKPDGTASETRVVAANPPGILDDAYLQRVSAARFRPRFVNGEPVATERARMKHNFWYFAKN